MTFLKFIISVILISTTPMSVAAQSEGQTSNNSAPAESEATRKLFELCQNPDATADAVESAINDGADLEAVVKMRVKGILNNRWRAFQLAVIYIPNPQIIQLMIDAGSKLYEEDVRKAARHNPNPKVIAKLLNLYKQVPNARKLQEVSLFTAACQNNQSVAVIQWFIETQGKNLNAKSDWALRNNFGKTPFQTACKDNPNPEVIKLLIKNGGILKVASGEQSPLILAAQSNTAEIAELLIKSGSDVNYRQRYMGMTAYLVAANFGRNPGIFKVLVDNSADPNAICQDGTTAGQLAATNKNPGIMAAVIAAGTKIPPLTKNDESTLSWANANEYPDAVKALLKTGIDVNPKNVFPPLLQFAYFNMNYEVIQVLLDAGADVNATSTKVIPGMVEFIPFYSKGTTPLMMACSNLFVSLNSSGRPTAQKVRSFIKVFIDAGANVNAANQGGYTPLMFLVNNTGLGTKYAADTIRMLIQAGADPNARNKKGLTAKDIAKANPKLKKIDLDAAFQTPSPQSK